MKPEIAYILIKFGKKEVTMTPDEARDLHEQLQKLFGTPAPHPVVVWPSYVWQQPHYIPCYRGAEITCGIMATSTSNGYSSTDLVLNGPS